MVGKSLSRSSHSSAPCSYTLNLMDRILHTRSLLTGGSPALGLVEGGVCRTKLAGRRRWRPRAPPQGDADPAELAGSWARR